MPDLISKSSIRAGARLIQTRLNFRFFAFILLLWVPGQAAMVGPAQAEYRVAPDVVVFCEPTLQRAVTNLGALWRKQTGIPVRIFASPTPALLEQVSHGARSDLLIGEGDSAAAAAGELHLVKPATLEQLWRNQLVVAALGVENAKAGASRNLAALAGKESIAIVDPWAATAGAGSEKALQALGLWQLVSSKSLGVVGTEDALYLLIEGKVPLAIVYATDAAANPALVVTDKLSPDSYGPIVYWAAQTERALSSNAAKFIAFLREPQARQQAQADGLEVVP
jgi:molybdate transport system substrate-binding protein